VVVACHGFVYLILVFFEWRPKSDTFFLRATTKGKSCTLVGDDPPEDDDMDVGVFFIALSIFFFPTVSVEEGDKVVVEEAVCVDNSSDSAIELLQIDDSDDPYLFQLSLGVVLRTRDRSSTASSLLSISNRVAEVEAVVRLEWRTPSGFDSAIELLQIDDADDQYLLQLSFRLCGCFYDSRLAVDVAVAITVDVFCFVLVSAMY